MSVFKVADAVDTVQEELQAIERSEELDEKVKAELKKRKLIAQQYGVL